ncbi:helix-turn-helix transcriptional regulator [uncultured Sulfitobacter sp.]|uniref:helix-turn-helix domain-containing protein n=1 Tax=uncultured Sulfitobacter sp. TaxID=191468 RepID=UPI002614D31E|nr:helix-turn-helix transcriptional regulator [uncultured Sulfitobacter sp.]
MVTSDDLKAFGAQVRAARSAAGWTLAQLAEEAFRNPDRKGYVSQIEHGRKQITALTVGKLAEALDLPESVTAPMYANHPPNQEAGDEIDSRVQELLSAIEREDVDELPEALVHGLAQEYAKGEVVDIGAAYRSLQAALKTAREMKARDHLPESLEEKLVAIRKEVLQPNTMETYETERPPSDTVVSDMIAYLKDNPSSAYAAREPSLRLQEFINDFEGSISFEVLTRVHEKWLDGSRNSYLTYDGKIAIGLAELLSNFAESPLELARAHNCQGDAYADFARKDIGTQNMEIAVACYESALKVFSPHDHTMRWLATQYNLGLALKFIGERENQRETLELAANAFEAMLSQTEEDESIGELQLAHTELARIIELIQQIEGSKNGSPLAQASLVDFDFDRAKQWLHAVGFSDDITHLRDHRRIKVFLEDVIELRDSLQDFTDYASDIRMEGNHGLLIARSAKKLLEELEDVKVNDHLRPRRLIELGSYFRGFSLEEMQRSHMGASLSTMADDLVDRLQAVFTKHFGPSLEKLNALNDLSLEDQNIDVLLDSLERAFEVAKNADGTELVKLSPESLAILEQMIQDVDQVRGQLGEAKSSEQKQVLRNRIAKSAGLTAVTLGQYVKKAKEYSSTPTDWVDNVLKQFKRVKGVSDLIEFLQNFFQAGS